MARAPATPRKVTSTQAERTAKRISRQQKALEKDLINEMTVKVLSNGGKMVKLSDIKNLTPLTYNQKEVFSTWKQELNSDEFVGLILGGCAGTGKSTIALYFALKEVLNQESKYKKIFLIRNTTSIRTSGFIPGTLDEKNSVVESPYYGICEFLSSGNKSAYEKLKETGKIEFLSTAYLRGETFNDCIVIVEECQCMNWSELKTINTRVGQNAKIIFTGDFAQNDLIYNKNDTSGWKEFMSVTNRMSEFRKFTFTTEDIVRSGFVRSFIIACERLGL
jgi:predicted ribonuclease YlaK